MRFQSRSACSRDASACSRRAIDFGGIKTRDQFTGFDSLPQNHRQLVDAPAHLGFERRAQFGPHRADDFLGYWLAVCSRRSECEPARTGGWMNGP